MSLISTDAEASRLPASIASHKRISLQSYPVIAAWHLELRPFSLADIPWFVKVATIDRFAITTLTVPRSFDARSARRWIKSHPLQWQRRRAVHWVIMSLEDDDHCGYVGLHDIQIAKRRAELRFWTAERIGRFHLILEAAQAAVAFAFTCLQVENVMAYPLDNKPQLPRVLSQFGMQRDMGTPEPGHRRGQGNAVLPWSVSRSHWAASLQGMVIN